MLIDSSSPRADRCAADTPSARAGYTIWVYFRNAYGRDAGLRIDHILLSLAVARRLKAAGVDRDVQGWEKASDHAPTWVELTNARRSGLRSRR